MTTNRVLRLNGTRAVFHQLVLVIERSALMRHPLATNDFGFPLGVPVIGSTL